MMTKYGDRKWKDQFIFKAYALAKDGLEDAEIAKTLGVGVAIFKRWVTQKEAFSEAIVEGRKKVASADTFKELVYDRLPDQLRDIWDRIRGVEPNYGDDAEIARDKRKHRVGLDIEFSQLQKHHAQQLYVYALFESNFNRTEASRKCGVSTTKIKQWEGEVTFKDLVQVVLEAKKDLFEGALVSLVRQGEPSAVIFANKTVNRDRGYNDKVTVEVRQAPGKTLDQLNLTAEEKRIILQRLRCNGTPALTHQEHIEDANFTVNESEEA